MLDEREMRSLETQVDALRTKEKDSESRKTYDQVFDHPALMCLAKLISAGVLSTLDYPVSTGKEASVFHGTDPKGSAVAVKIYRVNNATFRNIARYIEGDPRFKGVKRGTKPTVLAWARKEHKNLLRMAEAGVRVPRPRALEQNILVMDYIGDEERPAPLIRNVDLDDPDAVYRDVVANMRGIRNAALVHADLSEYNMLFWQDAVVIIDVGQAVPLEHHRAAEWFRRDLENVARYFRRLGVETSADALEGAVTGA